MDYTFSDRISGLKASAIREILKFTADPTVISFAAGNPAPESFPVDIVREVTADILEKNPIGALQYSISEGYVPLREALKDRLRGKSQFFEGDDLIITSGAQQAVELVTKCLCNSGDVILCENPSFIGSLNAFRSYNVRLVGIPIEEDGICLSALEEALKTNKNIKMLYLIPNFQNPSGITMSLAKRQAVYALAKQYGVVIVEDDPYGELRFEGEFLPPIKSFDKDGVVAYVGSFSKLLAPGIRVGYLAAGKELIQKVVVAKQVSDVHTNILSQQLCHRFMTEYDFEGHIREIRKIYQSKCFLMLSEMEKKLSSDIQYVKPQGGLFIWCTLPQGSDMMGFCRRAVENKVAVVPGSAFVANENDETLSFRMNFSTPTDEQIVKGVGILGTIPF